QKFPNYATGGYRLASACHCKDCHVAGNNGIGLQGYFNIFTAKERAYPETIYLFIAREERLDGIGWWQADFRSRSYRIVQGHQRLEISRTCIAQHECARLYLVSGGRQNGMD